MAGRQPPRQLRHWDAVEKLCRSRELCRLLCSFSRDHSDSKGRLRKLVLCACVWVHTKKQKPVYFYFYIFICLRVHGYAYHVNSGHFSSLDYPQSV